MRATLLKGITLGVIVGALTTTSTAALAGTGVGTVFNLGATNSVNASTTLLGSTNGPQLRVVDTNTGTSASGISVRTDAARPPLVVNSKTKVAKLNVDLLDGLDSSDLQTRLAHRCANGTAVAQVDEDGTTTCTTTAIFPIHEDIVSNASATDRFAPAGLTATTDCHVGPGPQPAGFTFHAGADSGGTLNWMYSVGAGTVNANGAAIGAGGSFPIVAKGTARVEGQFIWAEASSVITFTLHFLDLSGRCELIGTAEVAAI
jgi:hypothetical protein